MALVPLELARSHVKADGDDDDVLQAYLDAAEQFAQDYLNRRVFATQDELDAAVADGKAGDNPMVTNAAVNAGILLMCGHFYMNRQEVVTGVTAAQVPMGAERVLRPHRVIPGL